MKKACAQCKKPTPSKITIDGKIRNLQRRKLCLICLPFTGKAGNRVRQYSLQTHYPNDRSCVTCKKTFSPSRGYVKYCSTSCSSWDRGRRLIEEWNDKTVQQAILTNSTPRAKFERVRKHARQVMMHSTQDRACKVCGFDAVVEVCHIKGIAEFPETTLLREVNSDKNLIYLCPNHHAMLDRGLIGRDSVENLGISTPKDGVQLSTRSLIQIMTGLEQAKSGQLTVGPKMIG